MNMQTTPHNRVTDLEWFSKPTNAPIQPIVRRLDYPPVTFSTLEEGHFTCEEVNALYETLSPGPNFGPTVFLKLYDSMVLRRRGNTCIPGWYVYMVASYFLEKCKDAFFAHPGYAAWLEQIYLPKKGIANAQIEVNTKKSLLVLEKKASPPLKRIKSKLSSSRMMKRSQTTTNMPFVCGTCRNDTPIMSVETYLDRKVLMETSSQEETMSE
jgi:hypothetical protein